jgi:hypothetical protein
MAEAIATLGVPAEVNPDIQTVALACIVAPDRLEDVTAALPAGSLLYALWFADEILRRANALKKALLIEAQVALTNGEIQPELRLADKRYVFRQESKNDYADIPGLLSHLHRLGARLADLFGSAGYVRQGDLQRIVAALPEEARADAAAALDEHRTRRTTGYALVDLDNNWRKKG